MTTYQERKENLHYYVLQKDGEVLATFGNLRKVVSFMEQLGVNASYATLSRRKDFPVEYKGYDIWYVKHN